MFICMPIKDAETKGEEKKVPSSVALGWLDFKATPRSFYTFKWFVDVWEMILQSTNL